MSQDEFILTKGHGAFSAGTVVVPVRENGKGTTLVRTRSPVSINGSEEDYRDFIVPNNLLAKKRDRRKSDYYKRVKS